MKIKKRNMIRGVNQRSDVIQIGRNKIGASFKEKGKKTQERHALHNNLNQI